MSEVYGLFYNLSRFWQRKVGRDKVQGDKQMTWNNPRHEGSAISAETWR